MSADVLFLLLVIPYAVLGVIIYKEKFENVFPISIIVQIMVAYVVGIIFDLQIAFFVFLASSIVCWGCVFFFSYKHKNKKVLVKTLKNGFLRPSFVFFMITCIVFYYFLNGMLAHEFDEFTHWIDVVKAMSTIDDFATNELSHSAFKMYLPGMSLFQYLFQKVYLIVHADEMFSEWRCYYAYQLLCTICMLPLFSVLKVDNFKSIIKVVLVSALITVTPTILYPNIWTSTYIDPFVGIVSGVGLTIIVIGGDNKLRTIMLLVESYIVMLVLSKAVGFFFALSLAVVFIVKIEYTFELKEKKIGALILTVLCVLLPKIVWNIELAAHNISRKAFSTINIDITGLFNIICGKDDSYRRLTFVNFIHALIDNNMPIGQTGLRICNLGFCVLMDIIIALFLRKQYCDGTIKKNQALIYWCIVNIVIFMYLLGMLMLYLFGFGEYESVTLASFGRYLYMLFLSVLILAFSMCISLIDRTSARWGHLITCVLIVFLMAFAPYNEIVRFVKRDSVNEAIAFRQEYSLLTSKINNNCEADSSIYFISQESDGFDKWVVRFCSRPARINDEGYGSVGTKFYDGDLWTIEMDEKTLQRELMDKYDFLAIYRLNDYFCENFSDLFSSGADIMENTLYYVNKEDGLLYIVE